MGITGTDVSKEAAAVVLLDDNFTTIVAAVEEGRAINDNIRRFLGFSLAGNIGKLLLVFLSPLFGTPLPLLPFQILWLNLVTDGVLGLGIGLEPAERGAMQRPPQRPEDGLALQASVIYFPPLHTIFGTPALSLRQTMVPLSAGLLVLLVVEGVKLIRRRVNRRIEE